MTSVKPKILVVDDDESIRTQMKWALVQDYDVYLAADPAKAMEVVEAERPALVTLDLGLPPDPDGASEGLKLLERVLGADPSVKVVVVTGNSEKASALGAIARGAQDYFTKPVDIDELKAILKRAYYIYSLESEVIALQRQMRGAGLEIIGESPGMSGVFEIIRKVSTTDVPVLITGESGTGKELVAKAIHSEGLRKEKPFVPINCGAIPENLLESELFGHEKGAFTGAHVQRAGRIELANGGTLFLDEIGELPLQLQVKLLRFLQDYKFERVGGRETITVDVRVIAATNKDLKTLISEGRFREDLYYRLAVVTFEIPPLRDRGDDIAILARAFLQKFSPDGTVPRTLSEDAMDALYSYDWPGNVRELENKVRRAITLSEGPVISAEALGIGARKGTASALDLKKAREELEAKFIRKAMARNNGNITKAADDLGLTRPTLHHLLKKYGITK